MNNDIESIKQAAPNHSKYWSEIKIQGGPFADFSGGYICFAADNNKNALSLINKCPTYILCRCNSKKYIYNIHFLNTLWSEVYRFFQFNYPSILDNLV